MCFCFCITDIVISVGAWARDGSLEKVRSEHRKSRNVLKRVDFDLRVQRWCFSAFLLALLSLVWCGRERVEGYTQSHRFDQIFGKADDVVLCKSAEKDRWM